MTAASLLNREEGVLKLRRRPSSGHRYDWRAYDPFLAVFGPLLAVLLRWAGQTWTWSHREDIRSTAETLLHVAVLLLFAAGLLVVGVRSV